MSADVAIYAPFATPYLCRPPRPASGGAELQMTLLARALARSGLRVCQIVYPDAALAAEVDGVRVLQRESPRVGEAGGALKELRAVWAALHRAGAHTYVHRSAGPEVALTAAYCRAAGRRFVYSSSSTLDFTYGTLEGGRDRLLFGTALRLADALVVQSPEQVELARRLRLRGRVVEIPSLAEPAPAASGHQLFVWAGAATEWKDPRAFVELARALPEARFVMVVAPREDLDNAVPIAELRSATAAVANLELVEAVPRAEVARLLERAVAVVNTSPAEGMPNTFLEAWARGVPALSLHVDPAGAIAGRGLGVAAGGSWERFVAGARELLAGRDRAELGRRAQAYVAERHGAAAVAERWLAVLG